MGWDDLSSFIRAVKKKPGILQRNLYLAKLDGIASPRRRVLSTTQAIYHTLGSFVTSSHPIWPQIYTNAFKDLRNAQQNAMRNIKHSREAQRLSDKYGFLENLHNFNVNGNKKIAENTLAEFSNHCFLSNEILDNIHWSDIIEINKMRLARLANQKLHRLRESSENDFIDLNEIIKKEYKRQKDDSKIIPRCIDCLRNNGRHGPL